MATMHRQAERNTDVIDVFARALRDLDREVRDERMRREVLERRLRESEARMEELARVLHALARQGWVH
jgi:SOS response regulatory protein OraA/RecX